MVKLLTFSKTRVSIAQIDVSPNYRPLSCNSSFRQLVPALVLSSIAQMLNYSLAGSFLQPSFVKANVTLLIKKSFLSKDELKSYCSISGLCFILKLINHVVVAQLIQHIKPTVLKTTINLHPDLHIKVETPLKLRFCPQK